MEVTKDKKPQKTERNGEVSNDYVVKYTGLLSLVQVLTMCVSVARNKLASEMLFAVGVGLSSLYSNTVNFLFNATNLGLSFSAIKHMAEVNNIKDDRVHAHYVEVIRTWSMWTACLGIIICVLGAPVVSRMVFKDASYTLSVASLSLMVAFMSVTAGEMAVLKAMRRLKRVSLISALSALVTLLFTVPFYYLMGMQGILPALIISTGMVMVIHLIYTIPVFPWRVSLLNIQHFREGRSMIRLGIPYLLSGSMNSVTCMGILVYIHHAGSLSDLGMYGMGYNLIFVYGTLLFAAVDADYFPRLTSLHKNSERMNVTINQQVRVFVLMMAPFLTLLMVFMPLIIRLLYTSEFLPIVPMATLASVHLFFKSLTLPVAYIPLAKNDSLLFLFMDLVYDAVLFGTVVFGYANWGLTGTGVAIAVVGFFDWLMIYFIYHIRYRFQYERKSLLFVFRQFLCVFVALAACMQQMFYLKICIGGLAVLLSVYFSVKYMRRELTLFTMLKDRFMSKFQRIKS